MQPIRNVNLRTAGIVLRFLNPRRCYHRAEILHADRLPASGGAVIVSNHGRLDFDIFMLTGLILRSRGRLVRIMLDHLWFRLPLVRSIMCLSGAIDGTRENAVDILMGGEMILTYPGGVREILNSRFGHEHIDWLGRTGFANVAVEAGAPVIPVLGVGVNNGFVFLSSGRVWGKFLYRKLLRLGPAYDGYRDPLVMGILPLPLPLSLAIHFPLPCKVRYIVGEPIYPPSKTAHSDRLRAGEALAHRVADKMRSLIRQHGRMARMSI
jgi:1-acyl-sn-glycerol-3-phosphate acyltransferase